MLQITSALPLHAGAVLLQTLPLSLSQAAMVVQTRDNPDNNAAAVATDNTVNHLLKQTNSVLIKHNRQTNPSIICGGQLSLSQVLLMKGRIFSQTSFSSVLIFVSRASPLDFGLFALCGFSFGSEPVGKMLALLMWTMG